MLPSLSPEPDVSYYVDMPPVPFVLSGEIADAAEIRVYDQGRIQYLLAQSANLRVPSPPPALELPLSPAPAAPQPAFCTSTRTKMGFYGFMVGLGAGLTLQLPSDPLLGISVLTSLIAMCLCGDCECDPDDRPEARPPSP